jgi:hypothetical protein
MEATNLYRMASIRCILGTVETPPEPSTHELTAASVILAWRRPAPQMSSATHFVHGVHDVCDSAVPTRVVWRLRRSRCCTRYRRQLSPLSSLRDFNLAEHRHEVDASSACGSASVGLLRGCRGSFLVPSHVVSCSLGHGYGAITHLMRWFLLTRPRSHASRKALPRSTLSYPLVGN